MTDDEIRQVIDMFIQAGIRAEKAGFDGVQIHAAHFFFLSRFIENPTALAIYDTLIKGREHELLHSHKTH